MNNFERERKRESAKVPSSMIEMMGGEDGERRDASDARDCGTVPVGQCLGHPPKFPPRIMNGQRSPKLDSLCHGMFSTGPTMTYG